MHGGGRIGMSMLDDTTGHWQYPFMHEGENMKLKKQFDWSH